MIVALPGSCLSEPLPERDFAAPLVLSPLPDPPDGQRELAANLRWIAGWELASQNHHFGGFSALVVREGGRLAAFSDRSRLMEVSPERNAEHPARFDWLDRVGPNSLKATDLEAVYDDSQSGTFWAAFERKNLIMRFNAQEKLTGWRAPGELQDWSRNGGAEAMTRLESGQFLLISESPEGWFSSSHEALAFDGDPVEEVAADRFEITVPEGFRPVDAATLPDGQIAILLRKFRLGFPPGFESALLFGALQQDEESWIWRGEPLVPLGGSVPPENYEGLAVSPRENGGADLWLISDNNMSVFQRTYLIKLDWRPNEKARGVAAR